MPREAYAFQLRRVVPLLTEKEWPEIAVLLKDRIEWIKECRRETHCSIAEARQHEPVGQGALRRYEELTGCALEHPDELWAVRMSEYGALCPTCGKPFRTPKAKMCAECGYALPEGRVAGPLAEVRG